MICDDVTERILAACFEVSNELGSGFLESVYENALLVTLQEKGLLAECQVACAVRYRDKVVGEFRADILVEKEIIVELKAVKSLANEHLAQTLNYLKASGNKIGLLVNFGQPRLEYKRVFNPDFRLSSINPMHPVHPGNS